MKTSVRYQILRQVDGTACGVFIGRGKLLAYNRARRLVKRLRGKGVDAYFSAVTI